MRRNANIFCSLADVLGPSVHRVRPSQTFRQFAAMSWDGYKGLGKGKGKGGPPAPPNAPRADWWNQEPPEDPRGRGGPQQEPDRAPGVPRPQPKVYRSLGILKNLGDNR